MFVIILLTPDPDPDIYPHPDIYIKLPVPTRPCFLIFPLLFQNGVSLVLCSALTWGIPLLGRGKGEGSSIIPVNTHITNQNACVEHLHTTVSGLACFEVHCVFRTLLLRR